MHRVLHVITPSRIAGAETYLTRLLLRSDHATTLNHCIVSSNSAVGPEMGLTGASVHLVGVNGKANPMALYRLSQVAREFEADLVHSHLSSASWWSGWLDTLGGPKSIGHVHGFTSAMWHRRQTHLIACSGAVRDHLTSNGIKHNRITVLYPPVDFHDLHRTKSRDAIRSEFGVGPETFVVGTAAHLSVKKGYRELIQAAIQVLRERPEVQFWCFGEGPLRLELETTARSAGIADRFRLLGFRRDIVDLMDAIDVMALPSHREPFGLVYVEAALCNRPVIACDAGGAPEIVLNGETGLLIPPHDADRLAQAILKMLHDPASRDEMGRRGRQLALERFGWRQHLQSLTNLYERVAAA
ncbi:MAG: glycosyltransferase [Pirellulales bacterium]